MNVVSLKELENFSVTSQLLRKIENFSVTGCIEESVISYSSCLVLEFNEIEEV